MKTPAASFDEIRSLAVELPAAEFIWQPQKEHPRIVLYAATHGIALGEPGGSVQDMTELVEDIVAGHGPLHAAVEQADGDLRLYDLALDRPTRDFRSGPAMDEADTCRAAAYGMMAVEPGVDIFVTAAIGPGAELAAHAMATDDGDPLALLAAKGGPDIAAILGVILASRLAGIPLILDGAAAFAAAGVAIRLNPDALVHCRAATDGFARLESILSGAADSPLSGVRALVKS
ncbi:MAG TPA: nicotinate-nucleotide--dimethylbenzimidazole phosphoribosyltransferase [Alphaproteobacteria bacterium]|jgi:nicotinate-nucleotide--dimethylbenzimidazole phosphoribosyltransferase|nr:nicotinate-nucleotide--dimethylbenzimidazole phosphoribosyltransferase [Alphaproteobacteria bacterium]